MGTMRRRPVALVAGLGILCALAIAALLWKLPGALRFLPHAPAEFWALAVLAILVDVPVFMDQRDDIRIRSSMSVSVCFAIFLLWDHGGGIMIQAIAAIVTASFQRYFLIGSIFFATRLIIALGAAELVAAHVGPHPSLVHGTAITPQAILWFGELASVWFVVAYGIRIAYSLILGGGSPRREAAAYRYDVLLTVTSVLVATPLLTNLPVWWNLLVAVPLFAWSYATRERIFHERVLRRDPMTGLLNHRGMLARFAALTLEDRIRVRPFGLVVLRASENVPGISARLGRDVYEQVLVEFAHRLRRVYGSGRAGRLPGEGLVLILDNPAHEDPIATATAAADLLSEPMIVNGIPFRFHVSAGVVLSPEHGRDLDVLLLRADYSVTQAQGEGLTTAVFVPETAAVSQRRVALLAELHRALSDPARSGELAMVYQPQVDIESGDLYGVEALLRWTHPEWGPVPTDELIAAIEPSDVMHHLTKRVLDMVTTQVSTWNDVGFTVRAAVNASVQDLQEDTFADEIDDAIRNHKLEPSQLTIEITERLIVTGSPPVRRAAARIVNMGVGLSMDDFGTGHASLQELRELPITEVKIDKSYICGIRNDPAERAIVASVHELAGVLGVKVVAEGVEDAETAAVLRRLGTAVGQGWYYGRPMPAEAVFDQWHRPPVPGGQRPVSA